MSTPVRSASTSTDLLPFHQSRAMSPLSPGFCFFAFSLSSLWILMPFCFASSLYEAGRQFSMNHSKWSPTQDCPASYPRNPGIIPSSTTPHMPGTIFSSVPSTIWQVDVPMIISIFPGSTMPTAGTATWASTFAIATAVPGKRPVRSAISFVSSPAFPPSG